ncbi:MAG: flagellar biosynthetic protein FliR, partial [Myxococcota bacterium]|nr:flagellar biosynthetic protein FliR [Myxococcota bacterium]
IPHTQSIGHNALGPFVDYIVHLKSDILLMGTTLAAPIMAATFITDIVFGILNRVAPQLNAYFMSMPVKALGGVIIILVALYAIADRVEHYTSVAMVQTRDVIHHLSQTKGS